ncbi:CIC11C00000004742 [Sungouiella intermedia]|uniref:CIC11C00000004742 n=1 Tax=Sungouiella intermedia TaxID=45354 RepID=A0A1L0BRT3_9ASCO|nr:CIC11C00000004742 [[Candida] intermedia]
MRILSLLCFLAAVSAAIVGVDLGHQNTKAIMAAPGISFEIVFTDEGKRKDFSAISLKPKIKDGVLDNAERVYGSQIGSLCSRFPESCAANIKALLGKTIDDPAVRDYYASHFGVSLAGDSDRKSSVVFEFGSDSDKSSFSVEELTAMYLNHLKERVLKVLSNQRRAKVIAEDITVSIGPYASQHVRLAYLEALQLSNFSSVLGLVDEGTAVALSYLTDKKLTEEEYDGNTIYEVIYDVGAGSTTATLFSYTPQKNGRTVLDIQSVGFDEGFGGEFLTRSVYDILYAKFAQQFGVDDEFQLPPKLATRLLATAEKAKTILSANSDYRVSLESFYNDEDFKASITREEFESYNFDVVERAIKPILDALENAHDGPKTVADIKSVILNGGATRTPFIQKQLVALLGSEEKIAKVVNTDEACALGTSFRAYQLKAINSESEVMVKDRIFSNFEVGVNDPDTPTVIFPKGSVAANETEISLGPITEDSIEIGLYENGVLFKSFPISGLTKKALSLKCAKNESELFATFSVDHSKVFHLDNLAVKCTESESSGESEESTSSASNSTAKKTKAKLPARVPIPSAKYASIRPFTSPERQTIIKKLDLLKQRDNEKVVFEEHKNQLESECYQLRSYIEDNLETLLSELQEENVEAIKELASETVEWLEYDSDASLLDEVKEKHASIKKHKKDMENVIKMLEADLSLPALEGLLDEGNEVANTIQDYLLEYGKQISLLRDKYKEDGFDFDKENEKIMKQIYGSQKSEAFKLDAHFSTFKEGLKNLSELVAIPKSKFEKIPRNDVFATSNIISTLLMEMMEDIVTLQANHEKRVNYLLDQHEKLLVRRNQREARKKMKEAEKAEAEKARAEAEKEKAEKDVESETPEAPVVEDIPSESSFAETVELSSTPSGESSTSEEVAHDEL